ncbi:hypothetical protein MJT46_009930 [Ovis ammon polii x Ovis aries]|nr:hypothetical protein MJT46_009930 [Ovis ammon polii x Ovis aries]
MSFRCEEEDWERSRGEGRSSITQKQGYGEMFNVEMTLVGSWKNKLVPKKVKLNQKGKLQDSLSCWYHQQEALQPSDAGTPAASHWDSLLNSSSQGLSRGPGWKPMKNVIRTPPHTLNAFPEFTTALSATRISSGDKQKQKLMQKFAEYAASDLHDENAVI